MDSVTLDRPLATQLLFQAQKQPDAEVCGFVAARDGRPCTLYPVANVARRAHDRFEMDASQQIGAFKQMRERGEGLFAIYHSHPSAPPEPSARDIAELGYPRALYLIISLNIKGVLEMRAWRLVDGAMREVALSVID